MATEGSPADGSRVTRSISVGKDLVSLFRDGALFALTALLVLFPSTFNTLLVNAGFEEGSLVGFKWKNKLVETNSALQDAQKTISSLQAKNDELVKALAEANSKTKDPASEKTLAKLEVENRQLKETTRQVQSAVSQTIQANIPLVEKVLGSAGTGSARAPRAKSDYTVGLQTLGVPDSERIELNEKLRSDGYGLDPLTYAYAAGERPNWFADRSTVFYYAASAAKAAEDLARFMKTLTGQEFVVQRGAGLGVDPARRDATLFVHYVKKS